MRDQWGIDRRTMLRMAGGAAGAAALGGAGAGYARASEPAAAAAPDVTGRLPASKRFVLEAGPHSVFPSTNGRPSGMTRRLWNDTNMQGFAFDWPFEDVYVAQLMQGGLPKSDPKTRDERLARGDLCVTRLSYAGDFKGRMYVEQMGHGGYIGVEPTPLGPYLWTECRAATYCKDGRCVGYGTRIARFKFVNTGVPGESGTIFNWHNAEHRERIDLGWRTPPEAYEPDPDGDPDNGPDLIPRPAIDPVHHRLIVRYNDAGRLCAVVYDLAEAAADRWGDRLLNVHGLPEYRGQVAQGFTVLGQYMYLLHGTWKADDTWLTCVDLNTGREVDRFQTHAFQSLEPLEPEGMAIRSRPGKDPELCFGYGVGDPFDGTPQRAAIAYKNVLE